MAWYGDPEYFIRMSNPTYTVTTGTSGGSGYGYNIKYVSTNTATTASTANSDITFTYIPSTTTITTTDCTPWLAPPVTSRLYKKARQVGTSESMGYKILKEIEENRTFRQHLEKPETLAEYVDMVNARVKDIEEKLAELNKNLIDGLSVARCLERYKEATKFMDTKGSYKYANEPGGRVLLHRDPFGMWETWLTPKQLEAAQNEWSKEVKNKVAETKEKERLKVVIDDTVPGYFDE